MEASAIREEFYRQIHPSQPNDWEVDEAVDLLGLVPSGYCRALLRQVAVIWPISHSLCLSFVAAGVSHAERLTVDLLPEWVRQLLYWYELQGLGRARTFMAEVDDAFLAPLRGDTAVTLTTLRGRLLPYLRGLAGVPLDLAEDELPWTDGQVVFLPPCLHALAKRQDNEKLYIFLLASQWAYLTIGSLDAEPDPAAIAAATAAYGLPRPVATIEEFFLLFPEPELAEKIFHLLEFGRMYRLLQQQLPGLLRSAEPLLGQWLIRLALPSDTMGPRQLPILVQQFLGLPKGEISALPQLDLPLFPPRNLSDSFTGLLSFYARLTGKVTAADFGRDLPFLGKLAFGPARQRRMTRREEDRQAMTRLLAGLLRSAQGQNGNSPKNEASLGREEGLGMMVVVDHQDQREQHKPTWRLRIDAEEVRLPDEFTQLADRIVADLGSFPEAYVQAAVGGAGRGRVTMSPATASGGEPVVDTLAFMYDEWDFRRQGYRKNWCSLYLKELVGSRSTFPGETLTQYRGVLNRLRRQFEALRSHHRFTRRNRFGDDIDFDALVEAIGDRRAGRDPSERLFVRLLRSERDIAALFLIDMSNSTEGWVGKAIKEALVLLGEAMAAAGDRYGAYGFSGMRRSRCDLFHIKHLDEAFGEEIHDRIGAIMPREYTRMGAPIRHLTRILVKAEARSRLLIVLSDGKPEDYDDYSGEYAIEDTRKALVEARGLGIHPFCITIDQRAAEYLPHMYGQGNFIVIKEIAALPRRLAEMYRLLTS